MNGINITIRTVALISCLCWAVDGFSEPSAPEKAEGPQVKAVRSSSFKQGEINKIALVWPNNLQAASQESAQQESIDDDFTIGLMQKGYDVTPPSDVQSALKEGRTGTPPSQADGTYSKIGRLVDASAVMVLAVTDLKSELYIPPPPPPVTTNTGSLSVLQTTASNAMAVGEQEAEKKMPAKIPGPWAGVLSNILNSSKSNAPSKTPAPAKPAPPEYLVSCSMSARLYSVENGNIIWFGKVTASALGSSENDYTASLETAAVAIAQAFPAKMEQKQ